ncbi:MAG: RNA pseudouridine synthase, partial [Deltaproteobacteria bacterium]
SGGSNGKMLKKIQNISRQMLHARDLGSNHPASGQWMHFKAPVAQDMAQVLAALRLQEKDRPS